MAALFEAALVWQLLWDTMPQLAEVQGECQQLVAPPGPPWSVMMTTNVLGLHVLLGLVAFMHF